MYNTVLSYLKAGLCIIPIIPNQKTSVVKWKEYQNRLPQLDEILNWFEKQKYSPAVVGGKISGGLVIIDFDSHGIEINEVFEKYKEIIDQNNSELWQKLVIQQTPSGGFHIFFKCDNPCGNLKLATKILSNNQKLTIIETRGEGGYVLIHPAKGYNLIQGVLTQIPKLTEDETKLLLYSAKLFDEDAPKETITNQNYLNEIQKNRPGDIFNQKYTVEDLIGLLPEWQWREFSPGKYYLTRPGKNKGVSATFNVVPNRLYVFTTNGFPFEPNRAYDPFAIYTIIKHNGDFKKASFELSNKGYKSNLDSLDVKGHSSIDNIIDFIFNFLTSNYQIRYNIVKNIIEIKPKNSILTTWQVFDDRELNSIWTVLRRQRRNITLQAIQSVINSNLIESYNPIYSFFESLPKYNNEDHINQLLNLTTTAPGQEKAWKMYFTKWLTACVASAYEASLNHTCLVLVGRQGIGKNTFIDSLVPPELKPYYYTGNLDPKQKDSKIIVCEYFLINLDELETTTKDEIGLIKSLMTTEIISYRYPYGHRAGNYRHRANFIASINRVHFLDDYTGTRRFLPIEFENIDYIALRSGVIDIYQLWAQAKHLFFSGFQYWFDINEIQIVQENNRNFEVIAPELELLNKYYAPYDYHNETPKELKQMEEDGIIHLLSFTELFDSLQSETKLKLSPKKLSFYLKIQNYYCIPIKEERHAKRAYIVYSKKHTILHNSLNYLNLQ